MNKEKLVLTDGTEIALAYSLGINELHVVAESKRAACTLWEQLTKENLKKVSVKNASDMTVGVYQDMVLDHIEGRDCADETVQLTISLRSKTTEEVLIERLEAVESGQHAQDQGIDDLGQAISDIMEGGAQ